MKKEGFDKFQRKMQVLAERVTTAAEQANRENGEDILMHARAFVPVGTTGKAKSAIKGTDLGEAGYLLDFGPLSAILEGGTAVRTTKTGANRGAGPARPFVNPALKATNTKRARRASAAIKRALRDE